MGNKALLKKGMVFTSGDITLEITRVHAEASRLRINGTKQAIWIPNWSLTTNNWLWKLTSNEFRYKLRLARLEKLAEQEAEEAAQ